MTAVLVEDVSRTLRRRRRRRPCRPDGRARRVRHAARPVRLRQDHDAAHGGGARAEHRRAHQHRRRASSAMPTAGFFVPPDHRQLGMVFQSYAIWPHMTVFDNVAYPLRIRRRPKAEIKRARRGGAAAGRDGALMPTGRRRRSPAASSSASRSRARWCSSRKCCCSTSRCPISTRGCARRWATSSARCRSGSASPRLYVTHDQEEAMALSDRVVVMQGGRHPADRRAGGNLSAAEQPRGRGVLRLAQSARCQGHRLRRRRGRHIQGRGRGSGLAGPCARAGEKFERGRAGHRAGAAGERAPRQRRSANGADMTLDRQGRGVDLPRAAHLDHRRDRRATPAYRSAGAAGMRVGDDVHLSVPHAGAWAIRPDARA